MKDSKINVLSADDEIDRLFESLVLDSVELNNVGLNGRVWADCCAGDKSPGVYTDVKGLWWK
jgi:hypothetical protein